jgi:hypothetical protein
MTEMVLVEVSFRKVYANSPLAHEVIAQLGSLGFRIYDVCSYVQRPRDGELVHADIVLVHLSSDLFRSETWA